MRRWFGYGFSTMVIGIGVVIAAAWAVVTYIGLTRTEIEVENSWSRMENTCQQRMSLVPQLIEKIRYAGVVDPETMDRLVEAQTRASQIILTPELLNEVERFVEFQRRQTELSDSVSGTLDSVAATSRATERRSLDAVTRELRLAQERIAQQGMLFNEIVEAYNASIDSFPVSIVARLFDFTPKSPFELPGPGAPTIEASVVPGRDRSQSRSEDDTGKKAGSAGL